MDALELLSMQESGVEDEDRDDPSELASEEQLLPEAQRLLLSELVVLSISLSSVVYHALSEALRSLELSLSDVLVVGSEFGMAGQSPQA